MYNNYIAMSNYYISSTACSMAQMFKEDNAIGVDYGYGVKLVPYDGNTAHKNTTLSGYQYQGTDLTNLCSAYYVAGSSTTYTSNFSNLSVPNGYTITYKIKGGGGGSGCGGSGISSPVYATGGGSGGGYCGQILTGTYTNTTGGAVLVSFTIGNGGSAGLSSGQNGGAGSNTVLTINGVNYTSSGGAGGGAGGNGGYYFDGTSNVAVDGGGGSPNGYAGGNGKYYNGSSFGIFGGDGGVPTGTIDGRFPNGGAGAGPLGSNATTSGLDGTVGDGAGGSGGGSGVYTAGAVGAVGGTGYGNIVVNNGGNVYTIR
jgi:hypothetical protein